MKLGDLVEVRHRFSELSKKGSSNLAIFLRYYDYDTCYVLRSDTLKEQLCRTFEVVLLNEANKKVDTSV